MAKIISASILAANFADLANDCNRVLASEADWLHIDVMDNHYVPNLSFGLDICTALRKANITAPMDVHLMVDDPDGYIEKFAAINPELFFIHPETTSDINKTISLIKNTGAKAGLAYNPDQEIDLDLAIENNIDYILVMSVRPGFAGQKFIPESIDKVKVLQQQIKEKHSTIKIAIDGGIKKEMLNELEQAGVQLFILGSGVFHTT
jgi:ribulose-phosphate 3-epimerase